MKKIIFLIKAVLCLIALNACNKDFLDTKSDRVLVVPESLDDLEAILNNSQIMNSSYGGLASIASDEYYVTSNVWNSLYTIYEKNGYIWADDIYENEDLMFDWKLPYQVVFYSNLVLVTATRLDGTGEQRKKIEEVKARALFFRSWAYHMLSTLYCKAYDSQTADSDLGLPLRDDYDVNVHTGRASLEETFSFMLDGLRKSYDNLPETSLHPTIPNKFAAAALLSRILMIMERYEEALSYTDIALGGTHRLIDFNDLNSLSDYPIDIFNEEVVFHSSQLLPFILFQQNAIIDTSLYASYQDNDLRKDILFQQHTDGTVRFRGSYTGDNFLFNGITVGELMLNKAECLARLSRHAEAKQVLLEFMGKRYSGNQHEIGEGDMLFFTLEERRKEMLFRGTRWMDLKRLNKNIETSTTLYRNLNGQLYTLDRLSANYVFPIPDIVVEMSGIPQN